MRKKSNVSSGTGSGKRKFSLRERALLALFLWVIALLAGMALFIQFRKAGDRLKTARNDAAMQEIVLEQKDTVTAQLAAHVKRMESAQALQGATLQGLIDTLVRQSRLSAESIQPKSETKGAFQILSVRLTLREAPMERLLTFDDRLRGQQIPLAVTFVRVDAAREGLNVIYDIATYRLREQAPNP